jgi:hypothetical protein
MLPWNLQPTDATPTDFVPGKCRELLDTLVPAYSHCFPDDFITWRSKRNGEEEKNIRIMDLSLDVMNLGSGHTCFRTLPHQEHDGKIYVSRCKHILRQRFRVGDQFIDMQWHVSEGQVEFVKLWRQSIIIPLELKEYVAYCNTYKKIK